MNINKTIKKLLTYASLKLDLQDWDLIYIQNRLLDVLGLDSYAESEIDVNEIEKLTVPDIIIDELNEYLIDIGKDAKERELLITKIMGIVSPLPSAVLNKFLKIEKINSQEALDYLYNLQIFNNYIQHTAVSKNKYWKAEFENNFLEITINLSKPEKKNSDIAKLVGKTDVTYPKCLLCGENLGYAGRVNHPSRMNIRTIPLVLNDEEWFMQYSPYVYYYEHCIVILKNHEPMMIGRRIFNSLLEFVNRFPTFFIGSNAELPIVGGSILNHEHFQGGGHKMPMMYSKPLLEIKTHKYQDCKIEYLDWYNSVIKISSTSKQSIIEVAESIYNSWCNYSDEENDIVAYSEGKKHNTVTPIATKEGNRFSLYLILRNNRCNEEHPDGIFHAHKEYHNFKSEGIGLIEAMGMFILPARLDRQIKELAVLLNDPEFGIDAYFDSHKDLEIHREMITKLHSSLGRVVTIEEGVLAIKNEINKACKGILGNVAVFKVNKENLKPLQKFIEILDI